MKLFTKAILNKIPTLEQSKSLSIDDQKVWLKLFNACGGQTWYITSLDVDSNLAYGFVNLGDNQMAELGYIDLNELMKIPRSMRFMLERDRFFDPMPLRKVITTVKSGKHI